MEKSVIPSKILLSIDYLLSRVHMSNNLFIFVLCCYELDMVPIHLGENIAMKWLCVSFLHALRYYFSSFF